MFTQQRDLLGFITATSDDDVVAFDLEHGAERGVLGGHGFGADNQRGIALGHRLLLRGLEHADDLRLGGVQRRALFARAEGGCGNGSLHAVDHEDRGFAVDAFDGTDFGTVIAVDGGTGSDCGGFLRGGNGRSDRGGGGEGGSGKGQLRDFHSATPRLVM